jgi:hypothetical protein
VNRSKLQLAKVLCVAALAAIAIYGFIRLFVMSQRADTSILLLNVILFAAIAGLLVYLSFKERNFEKDTVGD